MLLCALSNLAIGLIIGAAALLLIIIICAFISMRNTLVRLDAACDEAWSTIDIHLKKRYDLIPNIVETVKGYAKYEGDTLERVIAARNAAVAAPSPNDKVAADNEVTGTLRQLFALTESYPDLKANAQFLSLQTQLQSVETDLAQARKFYNGKCRELNTRRRTFPSSLVAGKFQARRYFELDSEEERKNVKVSFN